MLYHHAAHDHCAVHTSCCPWTHTSCCPCVVLLHDSIMLPIHYVVLLPEIIELFSIIMDLHLNDCNVALIIQHHIATPNQQEWQIWSFHCNIILVEIHIFFAVCTSSRCMLPMLPLHHHVATLQHCQICTNEGLRSPNQASKFAPTGCPTIWSKTDQLPWPNTRHKLLFQSVFAAAPNCDWLGHPYAATALNKVTKQPSKTTCYPCISPLHPRCWLGLNLAPKQSHAMPFQWGKGLRPTTGGFLYPRPAETEFPAHT